MIGTYSLHDVGLFKGVISNDLEWLGEIFSDTQRRAVSTTAELLVTERVISVYSFCRATLYAWCGLCHSVEFDCLLVRHVRVFCRCILELLSLPGNPTILVFQTKYVEIPIGSALSEHECRCGMKKSLFSTSISLYLGNDTRYGHSCCEYETIVTRTRSVEWCHF